MHSLAIIIPAYKSSFLKETLDSLAKQTNKNFTLYIGDDCSPYDLQSVVSQYQGKLDVIYHRFETNMGGADLVGQWERCIALSMAEPWIWLFSDDDTMDSNCVEAFYQTQKNNQDRQFFHFNVNVIDETGKIIKRTCFPDDLDAKKFIMNKFHGNLKSFVVEYVFSRSLYNQVGGFQSFDLAWNSDDATWAKMALISRIKTVDLANVNWRQSSQNISPNTKDAAIVRRKIESDLLYIQFLFSFFSGLIFKFKLSVAVTTWFSVNMIKYSAIMSKKEQNQLLKRCILITHQLWLFPLALCYKRIKQGFLVKKERV